MNRSIDAAPASPAPPTRPPALAVANGMGAYVIWGVVGLFFKYVTVNHHVAPFTLLAHRVVWSLLFVMLVLAVRGEIRDMIRAFSTRKLPAGLAVSSILIGINWIIFIYAAATGQLVPASLGYFLAPIMNVVLGVVLLGERLRTGQALAIVLAGVGVAMLVYLKASVIWIPLGLTLSWSFYVLMRKRIAVGPIVGLGVETAMLLPLAIGYIVYAQGVQGQTISASGYALLMAAGVITAIPLMMFAYAARRLRLITLGLMQYVGPTMQFLVAMLVAGETASTPEFASFGVIWIGLIAFTADSIRGYRQSLSPTPPAD